MPPSDEAIDELRASLKANRRRLEAVEDALQANTKELGRFNDNIEDALEVLQQMMPMIEGAAAGSSALQMGVQAAKALFAKRKARRSG
jgi:chromosome segregation ATPase